MGSGLNDRVDMSTPERLPPNQETFLQYVALSPYNSAVLQIELKALYYCRANSANTSAAGVACVAYRKVESLTAWSASYRYLRGALVLVAQQYAAACCTPHAVCRCRPCGADVRSLFRF